MCARVRVSSRLTRARWVGTGRIRSGRSKALERTVRLGDLLDDSVNRAELSRAYLPQSASLRPVSEFSAANPNSLPQSGFPCRDVDRAAAIPFSLPQSRSVLPRSCFACRNVRFPAAILKILPQSCFRCRDVKNPAAIPIPLPRCQTSCRNLLSFAAIRIRLPQSQTACRNPDPAAAISDRLPQSSKLLQHIRDQNARRGRWVCRGRSQDR